MARDEAGEQIGGRWGLSEFQTGIVYLVLASAIVIFVGYQMKTGRVFTSRAN